MGLNKENVLSIEDSAWFSYYDMLMYELSALFILTRTNKINKMPLTNLCELMRICILSCQWPKGSVQ